MNYLPFLISLKSFEGRVRPENGNESQHLVLGDRYTLPSRVIIKLFGLFGTLKVVVVACWRFAAGRQHKTIIIFLNIKIVYW